MELDIIKYKNCHITVSGDDLSDSIAGLQGVHRTFNINNRKLWDTPDGTFAWIKLNAFELMAISGLNFEYSGSFTNIVIERSIDNYNWEILSPAFIPTSNYVEITYAGPEFIFMRMTIINPSNFKIADLEVLCDLTIEIDYVLSHNYFTMYAGKEITDYPLFPELTKITLQMMEGFNEIDKKIFDSSIFSTSDLTPSINVNQLTLTTSNIPQLDNTIYIWDFDEVILEGDSPDYSVDNKNIIVSTTVPTSQMYEYKKTGLHIPRLILKNPKWIVEFTESFTRV